MLRPFIVKVSLLDYYLIRLLSPIGEYSSKVYFILCFGCGFQECNFTNDRMFNVLLLRFGIHFYFHRYQL